MNSYWVRKIIGENTYKALAVYYQKLYFAAVIAPMGRKASRQLRRTNTYLYVDLKFGAGLGAILNEVLKLLVFEKERGILLRIRVISKFYSRDTTDCAISTFLEAIEDQRFASFPDRSKRNSITIPDLLTAPETRLFYTLNVTIDEANRLFFSRYRFKPEILREARNKFAALTDQKKCLLGLHYRGTDKMRGDPWAEGNPLDATVFLNHAKAILNHHKEIDGVYIATDEQAFLDFARREITTHPVYGEDLKRHVSHGMGLHTMPGDPAEKAKEAVMVMLMLAECRYMVKTTSLLSAWSKVINPELIAFVPQKPRVETGGYVFPDKDVYDTSAHIPKPI